MHTSFLKPLFSSHLGRLGLTALLSASVLTACEAPIASPNETASQTATPTQAKSNKLPPLRTLLSCLPEEAAIIAAHRGTDKDWKSETENAIGPLKRLIAHGTLMAEIDVAQLKDRSLITFHDGVWDDMSTGKGPISTNSKSDLENILLKSRSGKLTTDRPPLFEDMLKTAKGKMYLEIDFKSSANRAAVIKAIRDADMADQVLLIAYTPKAARTLENLAPEMLRSNPPEAAKRDHAVWLGYEVANGNQANTLKSKGNFTIGRIGDPRRQPPIKQLIRASHILVSDYAGRDPGIVGLTSKNRGAFEACLRK